MGLQGSFNLRPCSRLHNIMMYSFTLKCTNWFQDEKVDIAIIPSDGGQPWFFRNTLLRAGKSYDFNYDTVDWEWYQHDIIAILGPGDRIEQQWQLNIPEYAPGECPDCHGTTKCKTCHGQGFVYPKNRVWEYKTCPACGGTGICQTCHVPRRKPQFGGAPFGIGNGY
jgi:hypothetical protein